MSSNYCPCALNPLWCSYYNRAPKLKTYSKPKNRGLVTLISYFLILYVEKGTYDFRLWFCQLQSQPKTYRTPYLRFAIQQDLTAYIHFSLWLPPNVNEDILEMPIIEKNFLYLIKHNTIPNFTVVPLSFHMVLSISRRLIVTAVDLKGGSEL